MMDCLNEGWSLYTMHICVFCAWLNPAKIYGSVLVWNTCTTCIFLAVSTDPPRMDYWWSLKGRFKHTMYFGTLHAYLRSAYACAWIMLSNFRRWTRLWSWAVLHRWSTIPWIAHGGNFPRTSRCPVPRTSKWAMSKDLWIFELEYPEIFIKFWFSSGLIVALRLQY